MFFFNVFNSGEIKFIMIIFLLIISKNYIYYIIYTDYITLQYIALHYIQTLQYIQTLHYITLHDMTWHDITYKRYITLHTNITLHYITLYYIILYHMTWHDITLHTHIIHRTRTHTPLYYIILYYTILLYYIILIILIIYIYVCIHSYTDISNMSNFSETTSKSRKGSKLIPWIICARSKHLIVQAKAKTSIYCVHIQGQIGGRQTQLLGQKCQHALSAWTMRWPWRSDFFAHLVQNSERNANNTSHHHNSLWISHPIPCNLVALGVNIGLL